MKNCLKIKEIDYYKKFFYPLENMTIIIKLLCLNLLIIKIIYD